MCVHLALQYAAEMPEQIRLCFGVDEYKFSGNFESALETLSDLIDLEFELQSRDQQAILLNHLAALSINSSSCNVTAYHKEKNRL